MSMDGLLIIALLVAWLVLQRLILPRFGAPT